MPATPTTPFFVVSTGRSGTTMLRVILDRHPDLAMPPESHFIPGLWRHRRRFTKQGLVDPDLFLKELGRSRRFLGWGLPEADVRAVLGPPGEVTVRDALAAPFRAWALHQGKTRWADKTPGYVEEIGLLAAIFPEAKFVHMIRDGRDVALSMLEMERLHRKAVTVADYWARTIRLGRRAARSLGPNRYMEIRYEDLLASLEFEVRRLCNFVELDFDPLMLEHHTVQLSSLRVPEHLHRKVVLPPTKGLRNWRSEMSTDDVADFEAVAGRELTQVGYELTTPHIPATLRHRLRILAFRGNRGLDRYRRMRRRVIRRLTGKVKRLSKEGQA